MLKITNLINEHKLCTNKYTTTMRKVCITQPEIMFLPALELSLCSLTCPGLTCPTSYFTQQSQGMTIRHELYTLAFSLEP